MKVRFQEISEAGTRYAISDTAWFPDELRSEQTTVEANLQLIRKGDSRVELNGELRTLVELVCDFCLESYSLPVNANMHFILDCSGVDHWHVNHLEGRVDDVEIVELEAPVIDLDEVLREQLYLSLPMRNICDEKCRGLCRACGANLNRSKCDCSKSEKPSPFAALEKLKKDGGSSNC